jgi:hypothetical protein
MILTLSVFYIYEHYTKFSHDLVTLMAVLTYYFTLANWVLTGNRAFSIFSAFVLASLFFNLGQSILFSFTNFPIVGGVYNLYSPSEVFYMVKYQLICAAGLYLGSSLYLRKKKNRVSLYEISSHYKANNNFGIFKPKDIVPEILLYVSFAVTFSYSVYQIVLSQSLSYSELYETRETISDFFYFGATIFGLYFIFQKRHIKLVLGGWIWFLLAFYLTGTRSLGLVFMGALIFVLPILYPLLFQKKFIPIWIVGLMLSLISFNIISQSRQGNSVYSLGEETDFIVLIYKSIQEMGYSQTPTLTTISYIRQGGEHKQTILYNILLGIFPSVWLNELVPDEWSHVSLGGWATEQEIGPDSTYGLGYSWIAEAYMNYGAWGWIFTLIYGYFIASAENYSLKRIMQGRYLIAICLIAILCRQIFFARAQLNLVVPFYKATMYILIFWFIFFKKAIKGY